MANTTNLNMVKPAGTDHALISVINSNMDIIDGAVGALPSGSTLQGEIDSANTAIANINNPYRQTLTNVTITSDGFYASDIPIGKVISAVYGAGSSRFVLVRPSSSGMAVFHLFDDTMQKVTSTTVTINVWRIP